MRTLQVKPLITALAVIATLVITLVPATVSFAYSPYPLQPSDTQVVDALDYLRGEQQTNGCIGNFDKSAWVTMAIAAAGEDPHTWTGTGGDSIVDYLADNAGDATTATDYERMILAIVAADDDPTDFGGRDFVNLLRGTYDGSQVGDPTYVNDEFWGVMAFVASGEESQMSGIVADLVANIKSNQNPDGGWSWGVGGDSDVDDTAAAIMALITAGESPSSSAIQDGLAYIKFMQMDNGGFESWGATNSGTDSWAICAIVAAGQDPTSVYWQSGLGNDPVDDLLTYQNPDGSFDWLLGELWHPELMTAYAVIALLGQHYAVAVLPPHCAGPDWDVNCDHQCTIGDVVALGLYWNLTGPRGWLRADSNNDGQVTIGDVVYCGLYWGDTW